MINVKWMETREENPNEQQCYFRDNFSHLSVRCHVNISNFFKFINYCCVYTHTRTCMRAPACRHTCTTQHVCRPGDNFQELVLSLLRVSRGWTQVVRLGQGVPFPAEPSAHLNISETALLCKALSSFTTRDSLKASDFKTTFEMCPQRTPVSSPLLQDTWLYQAKMVFN